jgi:hypothetical protein
LAGAIPLREVMQKMLKVSSLLGLLSGGASLILWLVFNFFNPYSNPADAGPFATTFFWLFLPACLAIYSSLSSKNSFMFIAFIWSLPFSLYLVLTPGIFALVGATCIAYFISFLFSISAEID